MTAEKKWTVGLFALSAGALTVSVVGLATKPAANHVSLPVQTTTSTASSPAPEKITAVVTPSAVFPTTIPGCGTVLPSSGRFVSFAASDHATYDDPQNPWFSGRKAVAMSDAARKALPPAVHIDFASPNQSLLFQPILKLPENLTREGSSGWTDANADVTRDGKHGSINLEVRQSSSPPPACMAGSLDRRITQPDGTVIDVDDSWTDYNGHRSLRRSVRAYLPDDDTQVSVSMADENPRISDLSKKYSGSLPLSVDEAIRLVTDPGLRIHTPIPAGTPEPAPSCSASFEDPGPDIDRKVANRLNAELNDIWKTKGYTPQLDRPLGSLQLADYSRDALCEVLTIGSTGKLRITISGGHELPKVPSDYDPDRRRSELDTTALADGSIVQRSTSVLADTGAPSRLVIVTRKSGTQILVELTSKEPFLTSADLQTIASAPGLELP